MRPPCAAAAAGGTRHAWTIQAACGPAALLRHPQFVEGCPHLSLCQRRERQSTSHIPCRAPRSPSPGRGCAMLVQGGVAYQRAAPCGSRALRSRTAAAAAAAMTGRGNSPADSRPTSPQLSAMNWRNPTVFLSQASVSGGSTILRCSTTGPVSAALRCLPPASHPCAPCPPPRLPCPTACRRPRLHAAGQNEDGAQRHAAPACA